MSPFIRIAIVVAAILALPARGAQEEVRYFYDDAGRLVAAGWTAGTSNAAAGYRYDANGNRTGTLHIAANDLAVDFNGDGMPDLGPLAYYGRLDVDGAADPDGDGLANGDEFALLGNPFAADTDGDGMSDLNESIAGTRLYDPDSLFGFAFIGVPAEGWAKVIWPVVSARTYRIEGAPALSNGAVWTNLAAPLPFWADGLATQQVSATNNGFLRLRVQRTP